MSASASFAFRSFAPNPPRELRAPTPRELRDLLAESAVARRAWTELGELDRSGMIEYVASAREPHVRERRAALVCMALAGLAGSV